MEKPSEPEDAKKIARSAADDESGKLGIQSIEIGMRLLATLVEHAFDNPPPMLKTLAANAGMPPAKAHRYMVSLLRCELVERDPHSGRYRLGAMARLVGLRAIQSLDVIKVAGARLPTMCADLGHSLALAIWAYEGPTIIAVEEARRPITIGTRVGEVMPMLSSATGKIFGAWLPETMTRGRIQAEIARTSGSSDLPIGKTAIDQLFATVRATGVGWTEGGINPTINAVSAPIFDYRGVLVAALSTLGPAHDLDVSPDGSVATQLRKFAGEISADLGYTASSEFWRARHMSE